MSDDDIPPEDAPDEGPVTDPAELERLMKLADDPAMHGPMFRAMMGARVWFFIPAHPEMVSHMQDQTDLIRERLARNEKVPMPEKIPEGIAPERVAAFAGFCHVLMNSNEFLYVN